MTPPVEASPASAAPGVLAVDPYRRPEPQQQDYPSVLYWHKYEWINQTRQEKGITKSSSDRDGSEDGQNNDQDQDDDDPSNPREENRTMQFITDEKGAVIERWRASIIRTAASNSWLELLWTWGRVMPEARRFYVQQLEGNCPEVGYCANHWKADEIAIQCYPNFKKRYVEEIIAQWPPGQVDASSAGMKRTHPMTRSRSAPGLKRPKVNRVVLPNPLYVDHVYLNLS